MTGNSSMDRQLEEAVGSFMKFMFHLIAGFLKGIFYGIKKLNRLPPWGGLVAALMVMGAAYLGRLRIFSLEIPVYVRWSVYILLLCTPLFYLYFLGSGQDKAKLDYEKMLKNINFVGKDGKCPVFKGSTRDGKKQILSFKSNIPLQEWKAARARLETALDCNILKMEYGNSKKIVKLTVLPADFKIPDMITWNDTFCSSKNGELVIGQSALENISFNLNRVPHVLVAGETGSGKSVILRCMLWQMILQGSRVYMIDFKGGVEFGKQYERFGEVIMDRERALEVLDMLVRENEYRLRIFRDMEVKNLAEYNKKTGQNLCRIGIFSDEIAEMLDKKGVSKEQKKVYEALEGRLSTLARLSRATGINLIVGVQRPDANVLTGQIKNNIPVRISGRFADKTASEIVLGNTDAVDLPDIKGRFLYKVGNETIEFQSFYFDDEKMLHDIYVETGYMLTEPETYNPQSGYFVTSVKQEPGKAKVQKEIKGKPTRKKKSLPSLLKETIVKEQEIYDDADAYPDWEEEMPFPLEDMPEEMPFPLEPAPDFDETDVSEEMDFNFWEDDE